MWDFDYYMITKIDPITNKTIYIGTIRPKTWDVTTSTDEQIELRKDNRNALVCAYND